jgi:hypothetical protein
MVLYLGRRRGGDLATQAAGDQSNPGDALHIPYATYNDSGASIQDTGLEVTDIVIFKNGGVTERQTDSGVFLGDTGTGDTGVQYGTYTGLNRISLRIFNSTQDTGFYDIGSMYHVAIAGTEVDKRTVNSFLAVFEIGDYPIGDTGLDSRLAKIAAEVDTGIRSHIDHSDTGIKGHIDDHDTGVRDRFAELDTGINDRLAKIYADTDTGIGTLRLAGTAVNVTQIDGDTGFADVLGKAYADTGASAIIGNYVWDRVISAANHNISSSAGRLLRSLQEGGGYEGGAVWVDTVNGTAGATNFENGVVNNPVDSIADAKTIADSVGLKIFHIIPGSSITLAAAYDNYEFDGYGYTINLNGQSMSGAVVKNANVLGSDDGSNATATTYVNCIMGFGGVTNSLGLHKMYNCGLASDDTGIIIAEAGAYLWDKCFSGVAGNAAPKVRFTSAVNQQLNVRHYSGGIQVENMGGGASTDTMSLEGWGQIRENDTGTHAVTSGNISIRGNFTTTAITNTTLTDQARFDIYNTAAGVWDEADTGHGDTGTFGRLAQRTNKIWYEVDTGAATRTSAGTLDTGSVSNAVWNSLRSDHTGAGSFGESDTGINDRLRKIQFEVDTGAATRTSAGTLDTGSVSNAVWNSLRSDHTGAGSFGESDTGINDRLRKIQFEVDTGAATRTSAGGLDTGNVSNAVWNSLRADHVTAGSFGASDTGINNRLAKIESAVDTGIISRLDTGGVNIRKVFDDTGAAYRLMKALGGVVEANASIGDSGHLTQYAFKDIDTGGLSSNVIKVDGDTGAAEYLASLNDTGGGINVISVSDTGLNNRLAKIQSDVDTGLRDHISELDTGLRDRFAELDTGINDRLAKIYADTDTGIGTARLAGTSVNVTQVVGDTGAAETLAALNDTGGGVTVAAITENAANKDLIANAVWNQDMSKITDSGTSTVRTPLQAIRPLRNQVQIDTGSGIVYKEDDSTTAWTFTTETDTGAIPVKTINPAGGS